VIAATVTVTGAGPLERLGDPVWLHALWAAPAALGLFLIAARMRRAGLRRFAEAGLLEQLASAVSPARRALKASIVACALALLAAGLARPRFNPQIREADRIGRDIAFVVDVSRSMLAQDLAPSRLERTKIWIKDLTASLQGDRVALVAFGGAATIKSPLTLDRSCFELALEQLGPGSAPRGGTNIGDAIRKTVDGVFNLRPPEAGEDEEAESEPRYRDIVLITDGEDQGSFPVEAAQAAGDLGVRIIAMGVGTVGDGAPVPAGEDGEGDVLRYQGEVVRSRLDSETLADVAAATPGGAYLEVRTGTIDLEEVYRDLIASAERSVVGSAAVVEYEEWFWAFLAASALLLAVEPLIPERRRR